MEYIRIKPVTEDDFDGLIASAGGSRIPEEASADYRLNEAIIELKLVSEEGFEKADRQKKLATLFREAQPNRPVVLINPERLNEAEARRYYRIVETPIKSHCKKASKQLQLTAERSNPTPTRVLVILNVGYTLLSSDEFKDVCFKCVRNDTSGIDWVMCGGIYFYSDKFDNYVIAPLEEMPLDLSRPFASRSSLGEAWGQFLNKLMTDVVRNPMPFADGRMPVLDMAFDLDGVRYIKTAPGMPQSSFWPGGVAPRENSSGIDTCPTVSRTFPLLSEDEWRRFKDAMPSIARLKRTYQEWLKACPDEAQETPQPLKPLVFVEVKFDDFVSWMDEPKAKWCFSDIGEFSSEVFHQRALLLLNEAKDKNETHIVPLEYVHFALSEVGSDKGNDFASIYYISEVPGFERKEPLVENVRVFFEYGMAVAAAYAIKRNVNAIFYTKERIR
jgi:hypothetical protein